MSNNGKVKTANPIDLRASRNVDIHAPHHHATRPTHDVANIPL